MTRLVAVVLVSCVLLWSPVHAQDPGAASRRNAADFRVQVWGFIVADFSAVMEQYLQLRTSLEGGLPPLVVTADPADIGRAEEALARRIRRARAGARQGAIFTPAITDAFKQVLLAEIEGDPRTTADILDENPGGFSHRINGIYPKEHALSLVPPNVLALLPVLPADVQYRFLGRHLVLHDTRANIILDRIRCAIPCGG